MRRRVSSIQSGWAARLIKRRQTPTLGAERPTRDFYDWLMFVLQAFGVVLVTWTIFITLSSNRENGADMARAIGEMRDIAGAIESQASEIESQRPYIKQQAAAAADSAEAARTTASLASGQTSAIVQQANALIGSANATIRATGAQLAAAQANIQTAEAGAKAAQAQQKSAELLANTRAPVARLSSVAITGWNEPANAAGNFSIGVRPAFSNVGGGTLLPSMTSFNLLLTQEVPYPLPLGREKFFGGNESPIPPGGSYSPIKPIIFEIEKSEIDAVKSGKTGILVWGKTNFTDTSGKSYTTCYIYTVDPPTTDDASGAVRQMDVPSFRC